MEHLQKILVVDDEDIVRSVITKAFKFSRSIQIIEAETGPEGLEKARAHHPDLIILDWTLPDMEGIEVLKEIRGEPALKDVPVIMLTGRDSMEDKLSGLHRGANEYIVKPFDVRELLAHSEKLLARSAESRSPHALPPGPEAAETPVHEACEAALARNMKKKTLPSLMPELRSFTLCVHHLGGPGAGEDFYDIFSPCGQRWLITLGTLQQRGLTGAQSCHELRSFIRYLWEQGTSLCAMMSSVQDFLKHLDGGPALSLALAVIDERDGTVSCSKAGMIEPFIIRGDTIAAVPGFIMEPMRPGGVEPFPLAAVPLTPGDRFLLSSGANLSARMMDACRPGNALKGGSSLESLAQELRKQCTPEALNDDLTLLSVEKK